MDQDNDTSYGSSSSWMDNETTTEASTAGQDDEGPTIKDYDSYLNPFWTVLFSGSIITGTLGNLIVLWIVIGHRKMWTSTNYFLVNLSLTDLLMTILNGLFNFIYMRDNHWPFGDFYCTVNNFVAFYTVIGSVFTLTALTLDRYRAIIYPFRTKPPRWLILICILGIWISGTLLSLPSILYSRTFSNAQVTICLILWPDGYAHHSKTDYVYNIVFFLITYMLPLILMAFCYGRMGVYLWGSKNLGEENEALRQNYLKKKKVVKMFGFVVVAFAICWLPYHAYFLYTYHHKDVVRSALTKHVYLGIYWVAMSNTTINPMIYFWMNMTFRKYFLRALLFLPKLIFGDQFCASVNIASPTHTVANLSARNSYRNPHHQMRTMSQRSSNTTMTRLSSNRTSVNTLMNGAGDLQLINTDPSAGDNEMILGPSNGGGGSNTRPRITSTTSSNDLSPSRINSNGEARLIRQGEPADGLLEENELKENDENEL